jgi:hypothetical protein
VVVINGNIANIKEQGPIAYARELANHGIGALVFDYMNFGESEGKVRNLEDPGQKIDDLRAAVDFVAHLKPFAAARISLAGLGASAGYIAAEAARDPRVDRVLMIAPWLPDIDYYEMPQFNAAAKLQASRQANHQFQQDGVLTYVPVASYADSSSVLADDNAAVDYYTNPERGGIPQWLNRFATIGWTHVINFDAISAASRLRVPTLIVRTEKGPYPAGVQNFISHMNIKPEDHLLTVKPYDFYDHEDAITQTSELIEEFLDPDEKVPAHFGNR